MEACKRVSALFLGYVFGSKAQIEHSACAMNGRSWGVLEA